MLKTMDRALVLLKFGSVVSVNFELLTLDAISYTIMYVAAHRFPNKSIGYQ